MAINISQSLELITSEIEYSWHPTNNIVLLFKNEYSVSSLLQFLAKWSNEGNQAATKVCNLYYLRNTFAVTHYLLTRLYSYPGPGRAPVNLSVKEIQNHVKADNNCFWQFTRLLVSVENDTHVGPVAVGSEVLIRSYMKNLENNKDMDELRKMVDHNFNLRVIQCLKDVMDKEAWEELVQDLKGIDGANTYLLA